MDELEQLRRELYNCKAALFKALEKKIEIGNRLIDLNDQHIACLSENIKLKQEIIELMNKC